MSVRVWGINEGAAGMEAQVRALLDALGEPYALKRCPRRAPWAWLPNVLAGNALAQLAPGADALAPPWPELVISCGRRSAPLSAAIRCASGGRTKAVHIQNPQMRLGAFDLVVAMEHDNLAAPNVISTRFALHSITSAKLAEAAVKGEPRFAHLPKPWNAVLLGGSTNKYTLNEARMREAMAQLSAFHARAGGSLLISSSRRTGEGNVALLKRHCEERSDVFLYDGTGDNPYLALLALAERIVVSDDSVNMMTEAAATGKPLHLLRLPGHTDTKPARFADMLIREGIARPLDAPLESWNYAVPNEAAQVAEAVRALL